LFDVACHWVEFGIDGWRLDVPADIDDDDFWREFRRRVKAINPDAYIVGEIWHEAQRWLQGDQFDAVMNYPMARACLGFFVGDSLRHDEVARTGYHRIDPMTAHEFAHEVERLLGLYPQPVTEVQLNLLGSHDTPRFKTLARGDDAAYRLSTLFQMTYPGAPCIYYGDEIGMEGIHDPGCRGGFPWDPSQWDQDLLAYVRRCIQLRKAYPALRRGDFRRFYSEQGVVVFGRRLGPESLVVFLNSSRHDVALGVPVAGYLEDGLLLRDVWEDATTTVTRGRIEDIRVPARSGVVLEAMRRQA
jgi:neopullulanase